LFHEELPVLKRDFEKILIEAVDEGLSSLGESSKEAIYFHLDKNFNIKKHEIPEKIEAFAGAVESIFGFGANFLEIAIMRQLHTKVRQGAKWHVSKDLSFAEYVSVAKQSLLGKDRPKRANEMMVRCNEVAVET
jgi:hypothetical protein